MPAEIIPIESPAEPDDFDDSSEAFLSEMWKCVADATHPQAAANLVSLLTVGVHQAGEMDQAEAREIAAAMVLNGVADLLLRMAEWGSKDQSTFSS